MNTRLAIWSGVALIILDPWSIGTGTSVMVAMLPTLFGIALVALGFGTHYERLRVPALYGIFTTALWGFFDTITAVAEVARFAVGAGSGSFTIAGVEAILAVLCAVVVAWSLRTIRDERQAQQNSIPNKTA